MSKAENDEGKKDRSRRSSLRHRARARGRGRLVVPAARARSLSRPTALQRLREAPRNRSQYPLETAQENDRGRHIPHGARSRRPQPALRSEEHTSELQSLMRISYAVFCLKKKNIPKQQDRRHTTSRPYHKQITNRR